MKVLLWGRRDLISLGGGDKIQVEMTASELKKLGVEVDISTDLSINISDYDLVHVFQLDWTPETYLYAKRAKEFGKPLVLSPIHLSVKEVNRFDDNYAFGFRKLISTLFDEQHARDTWKNIYRALFDYRKIYPTLLSIFMGLKNMHRKTLEMADVVLVQTELEAKDLQNTYNVKIDWEKIENGVSEQFLRANEFENNLGIQDYILCVGRIEARKNQLNVIAAVEQYIKAYDLDLNLVFVGRKNKNHASYLKKFEKKVADNNWIVYVEHPPHEQMPSLYHYAKVCISASWFETSGLTSMEALFCGANVVASGGRAKEFVGSWASYCDPGDVPSIAEAIKTEYEKQRPNLPEDMRRKYTWRYATNQIHKIYQRILNANS